MSKAFIQKPAPAFSGTAVNKYGEFIDIKLSDYAGKRKRRIAQSDCFMSSWHIVVYLQGNMWSCSSIPLICKWDFYIYFFLYFTGRWCYVVSQVFFTQVGILIAANQSWLWIILIHFVSVRDFLFRELFLILKCDSYFVFVLWLWSSK